ncbi:MAG: sigma 54-interacting transcriptional regulator [Gemmatimonadales bacterium]
MATIDAGILDAWLDSTDDGALAIDESGRVVLHNPAASRVTGLAPGDAIGRPWREVLHVDPAVAGFLWEARGRPTRTRATAEVLCAQGNLRPADITAGPWTGGGGAETGLFILLRDPGVLCRQHRGPGGRAGYGGLVGADPVMEAVYQLVDAVAPSDAPVIIEGEAGTGKGLIAHAIHARSRRSERPLISIDCGSPTPEALEAELFGMVRGGTAMGRAELAHTGSLFLDGVSALSPPTQLRVLRLVQSGLLERGGDPTPRRVDVRVIAASAQPLAHRVREGRFDPDLCHRLGVVRIEVPSLRERRADIPLLAEYFLARHGHPGRKFSPEALTALQGREWPGNVRQLEAVVRHAAAQAASAGRDTIGPEHLPADTPGHRESHPRNSAGAGEDRRSLLLRALSSHGGNRTAAARALGIGRATFYRWWREAGLGA